jgi:HSP20 family protein
VRNPSRNDPFAELIGEFSERLAGDRWRPDVDVFETERAVVVRAEIAGVRSEDLRVTVDGDTLRISGMRRSLENADAKRLHQMEIATGPFERRVRIPMAVDRDQVSARIVDGFLTVTLGKRTPQRRTVAVERD